MIPVGLTSLAFALYGVFRLLDDLDRYDEEYNDRIAQRGGHRRSIPIQIDDYDSQVEQSDGELDDSSSEWSSSSESGITESDDNESGTESDDGESYDSADSDTSHESATEEDGELEAVRQNRRRPLYLTSYDMEEWGLMGRIDTICQEIQSQLKDYCLTDLDQIVKNPQYQRDPIRYLNSQLRRRGAIRNLRIPEDLALVMLRKLHETPEYLSRVHRVDHRQHQDLVNDVQNPPELKPIPEPIQIDVDFTSENEEDEKDREQSSSDDEDRSYEYEYESSETESTSTDDSLTSESESDSLIESTTSESESDSEDKYSFREP